ncbi:MAG: hypothetical protein ACLPQS_15975 [Acidimicrobiales bacterium]
MRKVPQLTVYFWTIKVLTTAMGEATSDYLVHRFPPALAVALGGIALAISLVLQFAAHRYVPWIYWLAVVMVAVFGTMSADVLHVQFGIPYFVSTAFFAVVLAVVFVAWNAVERTLSIHSIYTPRREAFYWAAVLAAFALGTAAGDLTATTLHLGYFWSGVMFAGLFALPALAYWLLRLNAILAFWIAYVLTRPVGASFADWADKPRPLGLNFGNGPVSLVLTVVIVALVAYLSVTHSDVDSGDVDAQSGAVRS